MTPEEQIKQLTEQVATLTKAVADKDVIIAQKNTDIIGTRKKYKNVSEMTEDEKQAMSEKELELQERQEAFEAEQARRNQEWDERVKKDRSEREANVIKRIAGNDTELANKIRENLSLLNGYDAAQTQEELAGFAEKAFNMLGVARPDPVRAAVNGDFGDDPTQYKSEGDSFADTERGKALASMMGLPSATAAQQPPVTPPTQ